MRFGSVWFSFEKSIQNPIQSILNSAYMFMSLTSSLYLQIIHTHMFYKQTKTMNLKKYMKKVNGK